mgnify:CR=1 FL=1
MNRFLTPIALLALVAAASAQESKTLTPADQGRTLVLDPSGKMRVLQAGTILQATTSLTRAPLAIAQGGNKDDERIRELSRKLAEISKELAELMKSRGMAAGDHPLAPLMMDRTKLMELPKMMEGMKADELKQLFQKMEKSGTWSPAIVKGPKGEGMYEYRYEITGKPKQEPVKRFFDEKMFQTPEPKQKSKVKKEGAWTTQGGQQHKIVIDEAMKGQGEYQIVIDKAMKEAMKGQGEYQIVIDKALKEGALSQEHKIAIEKAMKGHQVEIEKTMKVPGQYKIIVDKAMKEGALSQEHKIAMEKAAKQGGIPKEHQIAMEEAMKLQGQAMKEVEIVLKRGQAAREVKAKELAMKDFHGAEVAKTSSGNTSALMQKIAALEAQIKALKEENKRLREKQSVPPPQVEVRSKRIR